MNRISRIVILLVFLFVSIALYAMTLPRIADVENSAQSETLGLDNLIDGLNPDRTYLFATFGDNSFGLAKRAYRDGNYTCILTANLPDPEGANYIGWAQNDNGDVINIGTLSFFDGQYFLIFKSEENLDPFNRIIVSIETAAPSVPTNQILEGNFTK